MSVSYLSARFGDVVSRDEVHGGGLDQGCDHLAGVQVKFVAGGAGDVGGKREAGVEVPTRALRTVALTSSS
jgi:hypothetical protein